MSYENQVIRVYTSLLSLLSVVSVRERVCYFGCYMYWCNPHWRFQPSTSWSLSHTWYQLLLPACMCTVTIQTILTGIIYGSLTSQKVIDNLSVMFAPLTVPFNTQELHKCYKEEKKKMEKLKEGNSQVKTFLIFLLTHILF